jgi:cytochrome c peroxidase
VAGTAPYGWEGNRASLHDYIAHTVINLGGTGLSDDQLEELSKFLQTVQGPPRATRLAARDEQRILRGAALFESAEQGCSGCHGGPATTDAMMHDMEQRKTPVDTPSLRFVRGTAPYFHDGRYSTLEALLGDLSSPMGHSSRLPEEDRAALAAYLRTL